MSSAFDDVVTEGRGKTMNDNITITDCTHLDDILIVTLYDVDVVRVAEDDIDELIEKLQEHQ